MSKSTFLLATRPIGFSEVGGGWVHCAGSVTPWGTHMGSEEYEPDARQWVDEGLDITGYNTLLEMFTADLSAVPAAHGRAPIFNGHKPEENEGTGKSPCLRTGSGSV